MTKKGMFFKSFSTWDDTVLVINILGKPSSKVDFMPLDGIPNQTGIYS
jgi:hypothetical protein